MKYKKYGIIKEGKITGRYTTLQKAENALEYLKKYFLSHGKIIKLDSSNRWEKII